MVRVQEVPAQHHPWYELTRLRATARFGVWMVLVTTVVTHIVFRAHWGASPEAWMNFLRGVFARWLLLALIAVLIFAFILRKLQQWHLALQPFVYAAVYGGVLITVLPLANLFTSSARNLGSAILFVIAFVALPGALCSILSYVLAMATIRRDATE